MVAAAGRSLIVCFGALFPITSLTMAGRSSNAMPADRAELTIRDGI